MKRILIVEDHPLIVAGIRSTLASLPATWESVQSPAQARQCLANATEPFDLVLLDLSFRGTAETGFDLLNDICKLSPGPPVLILSVFDDEEIRRAAFGGGAKGFVSKTQFATCLVDAVNALLRGGRWLHESKTVQRFPITNRQLQIADALLEGLNEKEIADRLGVSIRMVESHLQRAKRSTRARSLAHLATIILKRGYHLLPRL